MATLHTRLPNFNDKHPSGEFLAAKWVEDNLDDSWHAWFQVNWLANVDDIDQILLHPKHGAFVVEVKGHTIEQILEFSPRSATFSDNQKRHPGLQAHAAKQHLASWMQTRADFGNQQVPWLASTAWFPRINSAEFEARFPIDEVVEQAKSMIFADDMTTDGYVVEQLRNSREAPIIGARGRLSNNISVQVRWATKALDDSFTEPEATLISTKSNSKTRREAVDPVGERALSYSEAVDAQVCFSGGPGTGKTSTLLAIGREHARRGRSVLYLTYNQVLAANVRAQFRQMAYEDQVNQQGIAGGWGIVALDLWDFYARVTSKTLPAAMRPKRYERWERKYGRLLNRVRRKGIEQFDVVLVDEVQDISDVGLEYVFASQKLEGSLFVGFGNGQSLYRNDVPPLLQRWMDSAEKVMLERSYRASRPAHLVIQSFIEFGMDGEFARNEIEKRSTEDKALVAAGQPRKRGSADAGKSAGTISLRKRDSDIVSSEMYVWELHEFLREIRQEDGTYDAMILLRHKDDVVVTACRQALIGGEIPFVDLIEERNRRNMTPDGHVKLVTYNSSRGLSAANVLVLGFDKLHDKPRDHNLAAIALSRASVKTQVVIAERSSSPAVRMLRRALTAAVGAKKPAES